MIISYLIVMCLLLASYLLLATVLKNPKESKWKFEDVLMVAAFTIIPFVNFLWLIGVLWIVTAVLIDRFYKKIIEDIKKKINFSNY